jgi:Domain of unknown function (DUF4157)
MVERDMMRRPQRRSDPLADPATFATPSGGATIEPSAENGIARAPTAGFDIGSIAIYPPERPIGPEGGEVSPAIAGRIHAQQGGGAPLEPTVQREMEAGFGHNFADVRVHADGESDTLNRSLSASAFTLGSDIFLSHGAANARADGSDQLLAHELAHVVQQRGASQSGPLTVGAADDPYEREAAGAASAVAGQDGVSGTERAQSRAPSRTESGRLPLPMPTPSPVAQWTVQRQPLAQPVANTPKPQIAGVTTVDTAAAMVVESFHNVYREQRSGLDRLAKALKRKKTDNTLIAEIASMAVEIALSLVLGPIGPETAALLVAAEEETERYLVEEGIKEITKLAVAAVADGVKDWLNEPTKKSDPVDNFIEAQSEGINAAEHGTIQAFNVTVDGYRPQPNGIAALLAMVGEIDEQAKVAASIQVAHSAGAWAQHVAEEESGHSGPRDSQAWANDDADDGPEVGALEIEARVENAPLSGPGDIRITGSKWRGINRETGRVVQEHRGAKIDDLGADLRIIIETPWGETRCVILAGDTDHPVAMPEKSTLQAVMLWLIRGGEPNPSPTEDDSAAVLSAAAILGYYVKQKSVTDLRFG